VVLIQRRKLYAFAFLTAGAVTLTGVLTYRIVGQVASGTLAEKIGAERALYAAIVAAVVILAAGAWALSDHVRFLRRLASATSLVRREGRLPTGKLRNLGPVGERIRSLFAELVAKNEALATRIDAQRQLMSFLLENSNLVAAVLDVRGTVLYANHRFLAEVDRDRSSVIDGQIEDIVTDVDMEDIATILDRTGEETRDSKGRAYYPVTDDRGVLAYVVYVADPEHLNRRATGRQMTARRRSFSDRIRRFFGRPAG
jgi:PAS domain-containing protein